MDSTDVIPVEPKAYCLLRSDKPESLVKRQKNGRPVAIAWDGLASAERSASTSRIFLVKDLTVTPVSNPNYVSESHVNPKKFSKENSSWLSNRFPPYSQRQFDEPCLIFLDIFSWYYNIMESYVLLVFLSGCSEPFSRYVSYHYEHKFRWIRYS